MNKAEIHNWLVETDSARLEGLWRRADEVRRAAVGNQVHLRGLVEMSNHCVRRCAYCGLGAHRAGLERYRMTAEEVLACAERAVELGYGTVVLQAGEDPGLSRELIEGIVRSIKARTPLAVTLSLGERDVDDLACWRQAGADRYLLRFETSNPRLYRAIHPPLPGRESDRLAILAQLRRLGYQVGSGVMIGLPGQTYDDLSRDIQLFAELDLDMVGVGPYIPHESTPLGGVVALSATTGKTWLQKAQPRHPCEQVPNSELMAYKVVALTRLVLPYANIPATTAVATLNRSEGRELALQRGANVIMPNLTPPRYRRLYEIYPDKACIGETAEDCGGCVAARIRSIGRTVGVGRGDCVRVPAPAAAGK